MVNHTEVDMEWLTSLKLTWNG